MRSAPDRIGSFHALRSAFFTRFFETEITSQTDDLKGPFFWLLAALAMPGLFIPWLMVFDWHGIALFKGHIALREASQAEKAFYLGFTMIATGLLTTIVWSSVLPEKRDTLVLGALPVDPRTIVAAKLAALGAYILLVAVSMHTLGAVSFGAILSTKGPPFFAFRGIAAHFIASCAASAAVALAVAAVQGLTLAALGPRLFKRVSTLLQAVVVASLALGLALLPAVTSSVVHTIRGFGANEQRWILSLPPVWFLGLYEWLLGSSDPTIGSLALRAATMLGLAGLTTVVTYPLAYRRLMVSVVEAGHASRGAIGRTVLGILIRAAGRHDETRAAADFLVTTLARVERQRFVLAVAAGATMAWGLPVLKTYLPTAAPQPALLSLPLVAMMFLIGALRIASSLPADIRASWLFEVRGPSRPRARQALERVLFALGVLPPVVVFGLVHWRLWGAQVAFIHAVVAMALGSTLVQRLIWDCDGMPCAERWEPAHLDLGRRWPIYLAVFLVVALGLPRVELLLFDRPVAAAVFIGLLLLVAAAMRYASARHRIVPSYDEVDPVAGVLRLN